MAEVEALLPGGTSFLAFVPPLGRKFLIYFG